ncbi:MAG: hypothetical protein AAF363_14860 [Bacteroidota bacterium]
MERSKSIKIIGDSKVVVSPANESTELDRPLYAINWFNLKRLWMYNLYNLLVASHLKKVNGKALYKGIGIKRILEEDPELDRRMLLVVYYPSADAFLKLVSNRLFLLKSVFRINSVKDFCIAFSKRFDKGEKPKTSGLYKGDCFYMAHVFHKGSVDTAIELPSLSDGITCLFHGEKTADIGRQKGNEDVQNAPFPIEGVVVWESKSKDALLSFSESPEYSEFKNRLGKSNMYLQKRIL